MSRFLIALGWIATAGAAFYVGTQTGPLGGADGASAPPEERREQTPEASEPLLQPGPDVAASEASASPAQSVADEASPSAVDASVTEPEPFTLEGVTTAEEANRRLMAHVDALLAKGEKGHLDLLRFLDEFVVENDDLERLFGSEEEAARLIYPWIKFLIAREDQVLDLTESIYSTLAEDPQALDGLDDDTLEIFTEGVSFILPGAVSEERMDRFRDYARTILDMPEDALPASLRSARRDIERVMAVWAPRLTPTEALTQLRQGQVSGMEALALLRRIPPELLHDVDLPLLLAPLVQAGEWRAIEALSVLPLDGGDVARLDRALLQGAAEGRIHQWHFHQYLRATNRPGWPAAQDLVEAALQAGGNSAQAAASTFVSLDPRPDAAYVRWALDTYEVPERIRNEIESAFGLR
ncbi:MAG: hypothetical protein ACYTG6_01030 [Planctomycetota bacterium]|jgi:hypothetical protein